MAQMKSISATGLITSGPSVLYSLIFTGAGAVAMTDSLDGSGDTVLVIGSADAGSVPWTSRAGIRFDNRIYVILIGSGLWLTAEFGGLTGDRNMADAR